MKEDIKAIYESEFSNYKKTMDEAVFIVESALDKTAIKIHSINSRVKKIDSLIKKAEDMEISSASETFTLINDIIGLRIICLFVSDITEIIIIIKENFEIIFEDNKLSGSDISSFGYFSVHFLCTLKKEFKGPRYDEIKNIAFEVQVRTISMDAWANISHYLDYKTEIEIPKELRKDFFALSGLFYVADTHFEMFFKNKKEQSKIAKSDVENNIDSEINFESLEAYINNRFKRRKEAQSHSISRLTQELKQAGYKMISDLANNIELALKVMPKGRSKAHLNRVGIVRVSLKEYDPAYRKVWNEIQSARLNEYTDKK